MIVTLSRWVTAHAHFVLLPSGVVHSKGSCLYDRDDEAPLCLVIRVSRNLWGDPFVHVISQRPDIYFAVAFCSPHRESKKACQRALAE
jgi:hypothetical protein